MCRGFGRVIDIDLDLVIPDPGKSLSEAPSSHGSTAPVELGGCWISATANDPHKKPFGELTEKQRQLIMDGDGEYKGIRGWFRRLERKSYRMHVRGAVIALPRLSPCPDCRAAVSNRTRFTIASKARTSRKSTP